jgi:hypothetical protein
MEQQEEVYKKKYKELTLLGRGNYGNLFCYPQEVLIRLRIIWTDSSMWPRR